MVAAIVPINAERRRIAAAGQEILDLEGITEVYGVAGDYDLVGVARVRHNDDLARLVTEDVIAVNRAFWAAGWVSRAPTSSSPAAWVSAPRNCSRKTASPLSSVPRPKSPSSLSPHT